MNKKILLGVLFLCAAGGRAEAANFAVITSPPTLLNILILGIAVAGVWGAFEVLSIVRGGELSKSWQFFTGGFAVLGLGQLATLTSAFELIVLPTFIVPTCLVVMTGLFLMGIIEAKRVLS